MKKKLVYILLVFSLLLNILVFFIDTVPFFRVIIESRNSKSRQIENLTVDEVGALEKKILDRSLSMMKSEKVVFSWKDPVGFTEAVFNKLRKGNESAFKNYNYPRAFLSYGLSEYLIDQNDTLRLKLFKKYFDKYYVAHDGSPTFELDKVDQIPFGNAAINLYKFYKEEKYKVFYETIYSYTMGLVNRDGLILYRADSNNQLNDVLGMVIPFLVKYYQLNADHKALDVAMKQMDFYISYGVDKDTHIPSHGISLSTKIKTGSSNWGRGIGWYLLGLSSLNSVVRTYDFEFDNIIKSLEETRTKDGFFTQYPGSSHRFDASTTTMFLYSFAHNSKYYRYPQKLDSRFS